MNEFQQTVELANRILDRPYGDPDDDLAMLSRQFLRAVERADVLDQALGDEIASHPYPSQQAAAEQHEKRIRDAARKLRTKATAATPQHCGYCSGTGEVCFSSSSYGKCPECGGSGEKQSEETKRSTYRQGQSLPDSCTGDATG